MVFPSILQNNKIEKKFYSCLSSFIVFFVILKANIRNICLCSISSTESFELSLFILYSHIPVFKQGDKIIRWRVDRNIEKTKVAGEKHERRSRNGRKEQRNERREEELHAESSLVASLQREFIESIDMYKDNASSAVLLTLNIFLKYFCILPASIGAEPKKNRTVNVSER